jgi:hypothetical protein
LKTLFGVGKKWRGSSTKLALLAKNNRVL